jgi:hypothetical protein
VCVCVCLCVIVCPQHDSLLFGACSYQSPFLDAFFVIGLVAFMCATVFAIYLQFTKLPAAGHVGVSLVVVSLVAALVDKRHILSNIFTMSDTQSNDGLDHKECCYVEKLPVSAQRFWRFVLLPPLSEHCASDQIDNSE